MPEIEFGHRKQDYWLTESMQKDVEKMTLEEKKKLENEVLENLKLLRESVGGKGSERTDEMKEDARVGVRYIRGILRDEGYFDPAGKCYLGNSHLDTDSGYVPSPEFDRDEILREVSHIETII